MKSLDTGKKSVQPLYDTAPITRMFFHSLPP